MHGVVDVVLSPYIEDIWGGEDQLEKAVSDASSMTASSLYSVHYMWQDIAAPRCRVMTEEERTLSGTEG